LYCSKERHHPQLTVSGPKLFETVTMDSKRELPEFIRKRKELTDSNSSLAGKGSIPTPDGSTPLQRTEFWKLLLDELAFIMSAMREINVTGRISPFGEEIARISLNDDGAPPTVTRTDLVLDGDRIRCSVLNGGIYYLNFAVVSDTEIVVQDIQRNDGFMDAREAAEHVVDRMLNILEWNRGS
jgi:hypothetical protein